MVPCEVEGDWIGGMRIGSEKVMGYDGICLKRCPRDVILDNVNV